MAGIRVIDCATVYAGPLACQILGDFGADVIKIEHPRLGDAMRGHGRQKDGVPLWWKMVARNKRCVGLDISTSEGAAILLELLKSADVLVESFRPGTLERWGLAPARLHEANPSLVIVRVSGFGQEGPYAKRPGFGTLAEAMSGFAAMTGEPQGPPTLPPFGLADGIAGISAAAAAVMALYHRDSCREGMEPSGKGQDIDLSILEPLVTVLGPSPSIYDQLGEIPQRMGNRSANNAPRNTYKTADGSWVAISTSASTVAERVMVLVGHPEVTTEPWFSSGAGRAAHGDLLDEMVAGWIKDRSREEVLEAFEKAEAAIAPVYNVADLMSDPHVQSRNMFPAVKDPDLGAIRMQNVLFGMSETPGSIRSTGRSLGADTDQVLGSELSISPTELARLREEGIIA